MPSFVYEQLNQDRSEIRLVQLILPQSENEHMSENEHLSESEDLSDKITASGKLHLRLKCQALNKAPGYRRAPFSALSYCWNPLQQEPFSMHDIQINNADFRVGYNLYDALNQFEQKSVTEWLWVDAICINQDDKSEKRLQIQAMREIYQNAEIVYMWLGNTTATDYILNFASEIGQEALDCQDVTLADPDRRHWHWKNKLSLCTVALNMRLGDGVSSIDRQIHLIDRICITQPLWIKGWVIQEVFLAAKGVLMSGSKELQLRHFEEALREINVCGELIQFERIYLPPGLLSIRSLELRRNHHDKRVSLKDILWQVAKATHRPHYTATDPRDLVLGLFGVLSDKEVEALSIDCTTSRKDIFIKLTRLFLRHERDDFTNWTQPKKFYEYHTDQWRSFTLASCPPREIPDDAESDPESLPTCQWVPDWATIGLEGAQPLNIAHRQQDNHWPDLFKGGRDDCLRIYRLRHREQPTSALDTKITDDPILRPGRFQVDEIERFMTAHLGLEPSDPSNDTTTADEWLRSVCEFVDLDRVIEEEGEVPYAGDEIRSVDEVLPSQIWQILNCTGGHNERDSDYDRALPNGIHRLCLKMLRGEAISAEGLTKDQVKFLWQGSDRQFERSRFDERSLPVAMELIEEGDKSRRNLLAHENRGRTLFKTATGRFGLGHTMVKPGDVITILWETKSPVILRKRTPEGWTFCGDCYVPEIMRGELMKGGDIDLPEEVFDIY